MILFQNSILKLTYNPATDILEAAYPDLHNYLIPEVKHTVTQMFEVIRSYDVKKLLLDSTLSVITVDEETSLYIAKYVTEGLAMTRLQKVARLASPNSVNEAQSQKNIDRIKSTHTLPFLVEVFIDRAKAISWLEAPTTV